MTKLRKQVESQLGDKWFGDLKRKIEAAYPESTLKDIAKDLSTSVPGMSALPNRMMAMPLGKVMSLIAKAGLDNKDLISSYDPGEHLSLLIKTILPEYYLELAIRGVFVPDVDEQLVNHIVEHRMPLHICEPSACKFSINREAYEQALIDWDRISREINRPLSILIAGFLAEMIFSREARAGSIKSKVIEGDDTDFLDDDDFDDDVEDAGEDGVCSIEELVDEWLDDIIDDYECDEE